MHLFRAVDKSQGHKLTLEPATRDSSDRYSPLCGTLCLCAFVATASALRIPLKPRIAWLYRLFKIVSPFYLNLPSKHFVMTGDVENIKIRTSKTKI
jgi:hypothetical protein